MVGKSKKIIETEAWVDAFIKEHGEPPSYRMIEKQFNIDASAAYARCKKFRNKMRGRHNAKTDNLKKMSIVELRIVFEKRFIAKTMTAEQMQGAEIVWQWIVEMCGGF